MRTTAPTIEPTHGLGRIEFIVLTSMIMALSAIAIDLMLPAFGAIREEFGLSANSTRPAAIVTFYLVGLAAAQLPFGMLADRFGRKTALYAGVVLYLVGAAGAALASSLPLILGARLLWGIGAAGPRVAAMATVRDTYVGEQMARAMSYIMAVFLLVPVVAPAMGAAIVAVASWRWAFGVPAIAALLVAGWSSRLRETLDPAAVVPLTPARLIGAARLVLTTRQTIGYTVASAFLFGAFFSFLASFELIMSDVYDRAAQFPLVFGGLAAIMGLAMVANARVVERVGVRRLTHGAALVYLAGSGLLAAVASFTEQVPFWLLVFFLVTVLSGHALVVPNTNALAMSPMGSVAGTAAAIIGTVGTAVGALLGAVIDRAIDGTVRPTAWGFFGLGLAAVGVIVWTEHGRLFSRHLA